MRFTGKVEAFASLDVADLVKWICGIPFSEWHQQRPVDHQLRPAMMTDLSWHGLKAITDPAVALLTGHFPGCSEDTRMVSVVMPGHSIEPHCDWQSPHWICRVHVPLTTNDKSRFIVGGIDHHMEVGKAYRVNTEIEHAVTNDGATPRIHLMFDVRAHA